MSAFKDLLESELLTDDTRKALSEAVESFKEEAVSQARAELEVSYAKKMLAEKQEIAAKLNDIIQEAVTQEIVELKEDIQHYKNIEPEYARKLEEFKVEYQAKLSESFGELVKSQVSEEIIELREDLDNAKHNDFGIKIFESFRTVFETLGVSDDMKAVKEQLKVAEAALEESTLVVADLNREKILEGLLSNLTGSKHEVMKTILEGVKTDKLDNRYQETIGSVLEESVKKDDEKETEINEDINETAKQARAADINRLIG